MSKQTMRSLFTNFSAITEAPGGVEDLRRMFIELAVLGKFSTASDKPGTKITWDPEELKLDISKIWQVQSMSEQAPVGWNRVPLAFLGSWGSGGTPTASRRDFYTDGCIPWVVIGDLNEGLVFDTATRINQLALDSSSAKMIPAGTVLIAMYGASIGKTGMTGMECCTNQAIAHCVVDDSLISSEYLLLVAKALKPHLIKAGKGAAQPNVSQTVLKHLLIDLPDLDTQSAIIDKVRSFVALCDQLEEAKTKRDSIRTVARGSAIDAVATASTSQELEVAWKRISSNWDVMADTPESVEDLRRLIIDLAIHGQLLAKQEIGNHGYPTDWEISDFASICNIEGGNQPPKSTFISEPRDRYIQLFQIRDLGPNPIPVYIPSEFARSTSVEGEILIGRYGASVGKIFRAKEGAYNVALVKFVYPKDKLDSEFVYWFLKSSRSQALFTGMSRSAQAGFNKKDLGPLVIPIPGRDEQAQIIYRLNTLLEICDNLEHALLDSSVVASKFSRSIVSSLS